MRSADGQIHEHIEKQQWDLALAKAATARQNRLVVESQIAAGLHSTEAAHAAAAHQFEQLRGMLSRQADSSANRARVRRSGRGRHHAVCPLLRRVRKQWDGIAASGARMHSVVP